MLNMNKNVAIFSSKDSYFYLKRHIMWKYDKEVHENGEASAKHKHFKDVC